MSKIKVSKTQLKSFKVTAENCDLYTKLSLASGEWMGTSKLDLELYVDELLKQGLKFQAIRKRGEG